MPTSDRHYAEAEARLGRRLTGSERRIDIVGYDRDLARGKQMLFEALEAEKARVIRAQLRGRRAKLKVTPDMIKALEFLRARGRAHAQAELKAAGVDVRTYAERKALSSVIRLLRQLLIRLNRRTRLEISTAKKKEVSASLSNVAITALARAMEKKIPGSLAIAADLVSSAMAEGLEEGFEDADELFEWWMWSAIMDNATCGPCGKQDGKRYPSLAAILAVGFPYPNCQGGTRCRCRPVPGELKLA